MKLNRQNMLHNYADVFIFDKLHCIFGVCGGGCVYNLVWSPVDYPVIFDRTESAVEIFNLWKHVRP